MSNNILEHKGFRAQIMEAERLKGPGKHKLPPGRALEVHSVDAFEHPLPNWKTGSGNFVIGVNRDKGLWMDFRLNDPANTAVLLSIKGLNSLSGRRMSGFKLEKYSDRCPLHDIDFQGVRFCKECNYKWPSQNYLAAPNTLWNDGYFNSSSGSVRQFFFTEEMDRSIPEKIIGKDDTVPAFGFAFFRTKTYRQSTTFKNRDDFDKWYNTVFIVNPFNYMIGGCFNNYHNPHHTYHHTYTLNGNISNTMWAASGVSLTSNSLQLKSSSQLDADDVGKIVNMVNTTGYAQAGGASASAAEEDVKTYLMSSSASASASEPSKGILRSATTLKERLQEKHAKTLNASMKKMKYVEESESEVDMKKEVGVGAGAEIDQDLELDPLPLSGWEDEPESVMRINFVFKDQLDEIMKQGMKDLVGHKEGFLAGLPVG